MEQNQKQPLGFGKTMLASALGMIIASAVLNIIGFFIMVAVLASIMSSSNDGESSLTGDHIYLKVDLSGTLQERTPDELSSLFGQENTVGFCDMITAIDHAKTDKRIDGIYVFLGDGGSVSWGQGEELRNALLNFQKETGKNVIAYGTNYSQSGYYVATAAKRIMAHPAGMVDFRGIGGEVIYYKDLLDKLDIKIDLIRPMSNSYKSAGETYTRNSMSDANREQIRAYITSIWNHVASGIAERRGLTIATVNHIADELTGYLTKDAFNQHLLDTLLFENDVRNMLKEQYGCKRIVTTSKYAKSISSKKSDNKIAVIYAEGNVVDGESEGFTTAVYSDDIVAAFDKAAKDDKVKAIVLRVNSPGGSATASEAMTSAIMKAKAKKPVIVSMSDVAASAGYEISCNATKIVAQPTTATGSIGVFATVPEIGQFLSKHLGITSDTVMTNKNSTGIGILRPRSAAARATLQRNVEDFYVTFCQRVAKGRGMTVSAVDSIARGRVWTGLDALKIGLVDTLGGMDLALKIAAEEAGIKEYAIINYPETQDFFSRLMDNANKKDDIKLEARLNTIIPFYSELRYWSEMSPIQARLPFEIRFE